MCEQLTNLRETLGGPTFEKGKNFELIWWGFKNLKGLECCIMYVMWGHKSQIFIFLFFLKEIVKENLPQFLWWCFGGCTVNPIYFKQP
jgi:hypothetical protein